eukprot:6707096-Alexandrium_andersonii.AAC.1
MEDAQRLQSDEVDVVLAPPVLSDSSAIPTSSGDAAMQASPHARVYMAGDSGAGAWGEGCPDSRRTRVRVAGDQGGRVALPAGPASQAGAVARACADPERAGETIREWLGPGEVQMRFGEQKDPGGGDRLDPEAKRRVAAIAER